MKFAGESDTPLFLLVNQKRQRILGSPDWQRDGDSQADSGKVSRSSPVPTARRDDLRSSAVSGRCTDIEDDNVTTKRLVLHLGQQTALLL